MQPKIICVEHNYLRLSIISHVTDASVRDVTRRFQSIFKPKVGVAERSHLGKRDTTHHSRLIEKGQKGGTWVKLSWNHVRL